ncbi:MAG: KpsF/GutQ family sugar-phosphate isomerase [Candidatus Binatia bacterium]|nr:KpsF/GutQ family sugar-phosphate isomerase [Candidatus Binatia bacterium]
MHEPKKATKALANEAEAAIARGRRVLHIEADAVRTVADRLDVRFAQAVDLLAACRGKIVVTGMGKSGIICRKIAATLSSTGSPAVFLHAAEAVHGDAGVFVKDDTVLALSYSGETEEVLRLLPIVKRLALPLVAMTGNLHSTLAKAADVALDVGVAEEACPLGLAPTASTTASLALGDALAVALLERRGFRAEDFAVLHPAGALGRRFLRVEDLMHTGEAVPRVHPDAPFRDVLTEITKKRLGITAVVDDRDRLVGVITDGDLRRALERIENVREVTAAKIMTTRPKVIHREALAAHAVAEMERHSITALFITDEPGAELIGVIHLHDLLKAGVV